MLKKKFLNFVLLFFKDSPCRMFERISADLDLLAVAQGAMMAVNGQAMIKPIRFSSNPSVVGGLAVAMATPLSTIFAASLMTTVVACVDGQDTKCKVILSARLSSKVLLQSFDKLSSLSSLSSLIQYVVTENDKNVQLV